MRRFPWLLSLLLVAGLFFWWGTRYAPTPAAMPPAVSDGGVARPGAPPSQTPRDFSLPAQAHDTITRVQRGGPFAHRQDGSTFQNREGRLPRKPRGYYREYTVETPGLSHRGARRIVTGGRPAEVWYYTDDHYDSFRRIEVSP